MKRKANTARGRKPRRLDFTDRIIIEACILDHRTLGQIASRLRVHKSTVLRGICSERTVRRLACAGLLSAKAHELRRYVRFTHPLPPRPRGRASRTSGSWSAGPTATSSRGGRRGRASARSSWTP